LGFCCPRLDSVGWHGDVQTSAVKEFYDEFVARNYAALKHGDFQVV
jgi:hypothetical protein